MSHRSAPSVVLAVVVSAAATCLAACELALNSDAFSTGGSSTVMNKPDAATADAGVDGAADDATIDGPAAPVYQGNPLCNASRAIGGCYPDDPITPINAAACNPDGGASDSGALACHVQAAADGTNHAVCVAAGVGTSGTKCAGPSDCAPGLECVGSGTCRPYCCSGESRCDASDGGPSDQFCDIQPALGAAGTQVPVCMRIRSCSLSTQLNSLAGPLRCGQNETCAVVRDDGATSCVAIGHAMAGEECDTDHCTTGLVCLGTPGQRRCYELCLTHDSDASACVCKGGLPLFPDPGVGICQ
jgi:hypothetical protein